MLRWSMPTDAELDELLATLSTQTVSYRVGLTSAPRTRGWVRDHHGVVLGRGDAVWQAAQTALGEWRMFDQPWLRLHPACPTIEVGAVVLVLARLGPLVSVNACRIVARLDEQGPPARYGFVYGTLALHAEMGEERFCVERDPVTDEVRLDVAALSRPHLWYCWPGFPLVRRMQHRFASGGRDAFVRRLGELVAS